MIENDLLKRKRLADSKRCAQVFMLAFTVLMLSNPAHAQDLKATGVAVFNAIYAVVGVCGAIAVLVCGINWAWGNFLGREDPKKLFFQACLGTAIAFGAVALVSFLKDTLGASGGGIGSL